jgi:methylaspartate ammonia-lyase
LPVSTTRKIIDVITYRGWGGYFFEDIDKIRQKFIPTADRYQSSTDHDRYPFVRTPAPVVGVGIKLDDGSVHWGDGVAVSFGGKAGRAGPGSPDELEKWFKSDFKSWCVGRDASSWKSLEEAFLKAHRTTAAFVRYAVSQAFLSACSHVNQLPSASLIARDLGLTVSKTPIPLHGSSGANWDDTVDRMLARRLSYLPQGQFENLDAQIGSGGGQLLKWIEGFKVRASKFGYTPTLTLDFHGALDFIFAGSDTNIADFIIAMAQKAAPHALHVESPVVGKTLEDHAKRLSPIRLRVQGSSPSTKIIADEWANEVADIKFLIDQNAVDGIHIKMPDTGSLSECAEAIKICKKAKVFSLLGGSCTETDLGARASVHLAIACQPNALLVKPGMGFDESFALMNNEMARALISVRN